MEFLSRGIFQIKSKLLIFFRLGLGRIALYAFYQIQKKIGFFQLKLPNRDWQFKGEFFRPKVLLDSSFPELIQSGENVLKGHYKLFYSIECLDLYPPQWHKNFLTGVASKNELYWAKHKVEGDIKLYWDLSRWSCFIQLFLAYRYSGEIKYLSALNTGLLNWCEQNKPFLGVHWMDGQECSIRLLNLLLMHELGDREHFSVDLKTLIETLYERIKVSLIYAESQANNHVLTETLALWLGGYWLEVRTDQKFQSQKFRIKFENLCLELIQDDGSFPMYSTNYHRSIMQVVSLSVFFQKNWELPPVRDRVLRKAQKLCDWIGHLIDPISARVPNLGHNDGSYLFKLNNQPIECFKNAYNLLNYSLNQEIVFDQSDAIEDLRILYPTESFKIAKIHPKFIHLADSGIVKMVSDKNPNNWLIVKYPSYQFRPSQADFLHIDLWLNGENVLFDAGTFSYDSNELDLSAINCHNTLYSDQFSPSEKIRPFLYDYWPLGQVKIFGQHKIEFTYTDKWGQKYRRLVEWEENIIKIVDEIIHAKSERLQVGFNLQAVNDTPSGMLDCKTFTIETNAENREFIDQIVCPTYYTKRRCRRAIFSGPKDQKIETKIVINP